MVGAGAPVGRRRALVEDPRPAAGALLRLRGKTSRSRQNASTRSSISPQAEAGGTGFHPPGLRRPASTVLRGLADLDEALEGQEGDALGREVAGEVGAGEHDVRDPGGAQVGDAVADLAPRRPPVAQAHGVALAAAAALRQTRRGRPTRSGAPRGEDGVVADHLEAGETHPRRARPR